MIIRHLLLGEWSITILNESRISITQTKSVFKARYSLTGISATGTTPNDAIKALKAHLNRLGLSTNEISWLQTKRFILILICTCGLFLTLFTMASLYPKYVLNALERNKAHHLHLLDRFPTHVKDGYMDRLCITYLYLRHSADVEVIREKQAHICLNE